jgi:hypothetical protein
MKATETLVKFNKEWRISMITTEALAEARKRWGPQGVAFVDSGSLSRLRYFVGATGTKYSRWFGIGKDFEEAFEDAETTLANPPVGFEANDKTPF